MKQLIPLIISVAGIFLSCGQAENKADPSEIKMDKKNDTAGQTIKPTSTETIKPTSTEEKIKNSTATKPGQTRSIEPMPGPDDVIAKIDDHLVSKAQFTVSPTGGISDCVISITNTLPDATFQKAMLEASIKNDDGTLIKTDYYTVINIEPGTTKVVKIPNTTKGSKVTTTIVKIQSNELTKGEWVLAGRHFDGNQ